MDHLQNHTSLSILKRSFLKKYPLYLPFSLATLALLLFSLFFTSFRLCFFSPFLALLYNRRPLTLCLWISFGCGLLVDLVSTEPRMGLYAVNFALTTLVLYRERRHFFEDKELSLSFFTALVSSVSTLIHLLLLQIFGKSFPFGLKSILSDLFFMPLLDGLYAFLWFTSPLKLYTYIQKVGWKNLFKKPQESDE